jgi:hypothetical protein
MVAHLVAPAIARSYVWRLVTEAISVGDSVKLLNTGASMEHRST